jgi:myo-inositol 2-dehydrogenase/D-chiro-inositol 1-dehydrogenase
MGKNRLSRVCAAGITAVQPDLKKHKEKENVVGIMEFRDRQILDVDVSWRMAAEQEESTEVINSGPKLIVNMNPSSNLVNLHD